MRRARQPRYMLGVDICDRYCKYQKKSFVVLFEVMEPDPYGPVLTELNTIINHTENVWMVHKRMTPLSVDHYIR